MRELIYKQDAIDALIKWYGCEPTDIGAFENIIEELPSAEPDYTYCANAMLAMWMDEVLTDGEYNRIMDKLNAHWAERKENTDER